MGIFFSKKKVVWVPVNEKLAEKAAASEEWQAVESFKGWKVSSEHSRSSCNVL
jgi:hypothetical protein